MYIAMSPEVNRSTRSTSLYVYRRNNKLYDKDVSLAKIYYLKEKLNMKKI